MNIKWKIGIHIAVTLIIGIAIGAMLNRALVRHWIRDSLSMRGAGLRAPGGELPFKPTDAAQEAKIQKVLDQHAQRLSAIHDRYGKEIEASFKSLKSSLDPILTPEQRAEFEKRSRGRRLGSGGRAASRAAGDPAKKDRAVFRAIVGREALFQAAPPTEGWEAPAGAVREWAICPSPGGPWRVSSGWPS